MSGEPEGVSLLEAIDAGRIETPGELKFPEWQAWRRGPGMRPTRKRDGRGIRTGDEVALWKEVMTALYGEGRAGALQSEGEEEEELVPVVPSLPAGGGPVGLGGFSTPPYSPSFLGSEEGRQSPRPSSVGSGSASVSSLKGRLDALYDPANEEFSAYLARMGRVISALRSLDASVPPKTLEKITKKAELMIELHAEFGGVERGRGVRFFRDKFVRTVQDESLDSEERELTIVALGEIIEKLGGKLSASPEKLFSTPSDDRDQGKKDELAARSPKDGRVSKMGALDVSGAAKEGDSPLRARLAALEMELEALKRDKAESEVGSSAGGQDQSFAAALEAQTKVLQEALSGRGKDSSVTAVKTDLHWPTLGDDRADSRDVSQFYEEFEDVCALANSCKGMSHREMLLALRARCRGSRLKTYQNMYRAAWKAGEILEDPGSVYERIKAKHLMFTESREEREIRIDAEHAALMKGRLTGHQFEPVFEASVAELEAVGLGKTARELFLSYLRKMPPTLQKEIRADKRIWASEDRLRGPQTWEEAHRVVLEYEQREATNRATANAVYAATSGAEVPDQKNPSGKPKAKAKSTAVGVTAGDPRKDKLCWAYRDHGSCPKGKDCPFAHDKEMRRKALESKGKGKGGQSSGQESYPAKGGGKQSGQGKGRGKNGKDKGKKQGQTAKRDKPCPFFSKNGACKKGDACDMSHSLPATTSTGAAGTSQWGAGPSGAGLTNPFAAFTVVEVRPGGKQGPKSAVAAAVCAAATRHGPEDGKKGNIVSLDELPKDWWKVVPNEKGGYQYKTVTKVLGTFVETLLDGGAGSNHVTEELVVSILNKAVAMGLKPNDPKFPVVQLEQWVYPEFVHGIASGSPVPLKGAVVLRVRLQEGTDVHNCVDGHELFVRCKIAARGTSDWHGLILGGRALDCEARRGLGFRPGPESHVFDTLGARIPRCEDASGERHDRAYVFQSVVSAVEENLAEVNEPKTGQRASVVFAGSEDVQLFPGEGALVPVEVKGSFVTDASLCEAIFPVEGETEVVPGLWNTGSREGMVLVVPRHEEVILEAGDQVGELRNGLVASTQCVCGAVDTVFQSTERKEPCPECGKAIMSVKTEQCYACGETKGKETYRLQGCRCGSKPKRSGSQTSKGKVRGYGVLATMVGLLSLLPGVPSMFAYSVRSETARKADHWVTFPGGWARVHEEPREELYSLRSEDFPGEVTAVGSRRVTVGHFINGESFEWEDERTSNSWVFQGKRWVGETRFFEKSSEGPEASWRSTITEPVYHIVEVAGGIDRMAEETPSDFYYSKLRESLEERYPKADRFLLDHLVSLEAFLDKSIIFGFSYGVAKADLCVTHGKLLGHLVGRNGTGPDPERSQAVRDFAPLKEKLHIQQFLGCTNWLRTYLPAEFGHCAKILTKFQKPGAVFPEGGLGSGDSEGCRAVKAIKQMMAKAIEVTVFDEAAAISGVCPLEQIADASGIAVGGTVLQMSRDLTRMKVLLTHSRSLTAPQQAWPPLVQEAFAQLEVKRATRKAFGSIRTLCWTDHANLTRAQHIEIGSDVKLIRWVAEILADGSEIRSLSGRSAKLGDGFSRNPKDRDELLQGRTRDLQGLAGHLRGFDMEAYLGGDTEDPDIPITWAVGNDTVPEKASGTQGPGDRGDVSVSERPAEDHAGVIHRGKVSVSELSASYPTEGRPTGDHGQGITILFVSDYVNHSASAPEIARVHSTFSHSMPGWKISVRVAYGAFEDDDGVVAHLDGCTAVLKGEKQIKRARVDMLTSCATVLRNIGQHLPDFLIGVGQGGLVVGLLRFPLVVETVLQARNLQREEIRKVVGGWAGLKAVWAVNPRMWKVKPSPELLLGACPELKKEFPIAPVTGYGLVTRVPKEDEVKEVAAALRLGLVKGLAEPPLISLAREQEREVWEHDGKCSCGKRTYVFGRCTTCIEKEAADDLIQGAQQREEAEKEEGEEGELVAEGLFALSSRPLTPTEPRSCQVHFKLVQNWARSWFAAGKEGKFVELPRGLGLVAGIKWRAEKKLSLPELSKSQSKDLPYGISWCVHPGWIIALVHQCCDMTRIGRIEPKWELDEVNWHNHRYLVSRVCEEIWKSGERFYHWNHDFGRLISLLGEPTEVSMWEDGSGPASIGKRRELRNRRVLVVFQKEVETGYWSPTSLGKKIRVNETSSRPTIAVVGRSWPWRLVLHLRTKFWILPQWVGAPDEEIAAAAIEIEEEGPTREELAASARLEAGVAEFEVTGALRSAWYDGQKKDSSLAGHFRRPGDPFRIAGDGLLERAVTLETGEKIWACVVPYGFVGAQGMTWRRACFDQAHSGALGGHRSADRTLKILSRKVWWAGMKEDVQKWTERCLICLKARGRPTKVTAQASRCLADSCWQEISIDAEGPNREDRWGYRYTLTYLDCLSHAVLIEPLRSLTHAEVRRAFSRCLFRSRTIPTMIRSDRGPEFRNSLMAEFCALMGYGIKQRFAMSLRPCEMGSNERMHQEVQKTLHVLIKEVARGETDEWSELLPLVEYILDNTPGAHGYTPRDLERSWSLGLDLEKDLVRESLRFEPVTEWAQKQFSQFASLAAKVRTHWEKASAARAKLANRYRRSVEFKIGDRVVWESPQPRPAGAGRVPWKRGLSGPWEIVEVRGNRLVLRSVQDSAHRPVEAHSEDCVLVPADVDEGPDLSRDLLLDDGAPDEPPSLGQRLKGEGEQREFVMQRRGRQFVLRIGDVVAYTKGFKVCHFGRVTQVSVAEGTVGVHKYRPITGSLRVKWVLSFLNEEGVIDENGTRPLIEQVKLKEIVTKADISRDGVLAASTSRKLDKSG